MRYRAETRRAFLRRCLATGALAAAPGLALPLRAARATPGASLVVVFQRGAADGLNAVVPYFDGDYYALRKSLAIAPPAAGPGSAVNLDGSFGLHPALASLLPAYDAGELALLPCVGYDAATRSHFEEQSHLEIESTDTRLDGWLNRYLQSYGSYAPLRAVSFGGHTARMLLGAAPVSTFGDLADFTLSDNPQARALLEVLSPLFDTGPYDTPYQTALRAAGQSLNEDFQAVQSLGRDYVPAGGAQYPDSSLGHQLMQSAQLLKAGIGTEIVTIDAGGWDTHYNQGTTDGRHAAVLDDLGRALAAFRADMGPAMASVLVLVMTEFGRTPDKNASGGTDHGRAAAWMALGGAVHGGIHLGPQGWPGLGPADLYEGRYLRHTVDFRDVYAEILRRHMGAADPSGVLLGYQDSTVGFLV